MSSEGLIVVDKPRGLTSHDVVARLRRMAHTRRVGHAGTLDPMATGVLVMGVGRATRLLTYIVGADKCYQATIRLGVSTVTDDAEGEVLTRTSAASVTEAALRQAISMFVGDIDQIPSAVSAIKVGGVRSYARARKGETVDLPPRRVRISRLDVLAARFGPASMVLDVDVEVACSSGTYIRAIARDLGATLRVGGHLIALRRVAVGDYTLAESLTLPALATRADPVTVPMPAAVERMFTRCDVDEAAARLLSHGGPLAAQGIDGRYAVFAPDGHPVAIVLETDGTARAEVVLAGPERSERPATPRPAGSARPDRSDSARSDSARSDGPDGPDRLDEPDRLAERG